MLIPQYTLYYSPRSPFARRIRLMMAKLGLEFAPKESDAFHPTPEFLKANPLGLLPALVVKAGKEEYSLFDSSTILEYLHEQHGERIWPKDLAARTKVRRASTLAEGLMRLTVDLFLEKQRSHPDAAWEQEWLQNLDRGLAEIAAEPLNRLPWKENDLKLTMAGYDLAIVLEYMEVRIPYVAWKERYPALAAFLDSHRKRADLAPTAPPPA